MPITWWQRVAQWMWPDPVVPGCRYLLPDGQTCTVVATMGLQVVYVIGSAQFCTMGQPGMFRIDPALDAPTHAALPAIAATRQPYI